MTLTVLTVIQVLLAIAMIAIILVQRGPGASAGSGFGGGASATVFGARGSGSFLTRTTAILATTFFALSLGMAVLVSRTIEPAAETDLGIMGQVESPAAVPRPAADGDGAGAGPTGLRPTGVEEVPSMPVEDAVPTADGDDSGS